MSPAGGFAEQRERVDAEKENAGGDSAITIMLDCPDYPGLDERSKV